MSFRFSGAGPGVQTPDGCSVDLYRRLGYYGELDEHRALFVPGRQVLELGCGAGRLTRQLLEWGAGVTAVDNSPEMLAELPEDAVKVLCDIETLNLDRRFDVALLASNLINHPAASVRAAFVGCARRHLRHHGCLLLERYDADWLRQVEPGVVGGVGAVSITVQTVSRNAGVVCMTLRYDVDGRQWRHSFSVVPLTEAEIEALLSSYSFGSFAWSGKNNRWLRASRN